MNVSFFATLKQDEYLRFIILSDHLYEIFIIYLKVIIVAENKYIWKVMAQG